MGRTRRAMSPSLMHTLLPSKPERPEYANPIVNRLHEVAAQAQPQVLSSSMGRPPPGLLGRRGPTLSQHLSKPNPCDETDATLTTGGQSALGSMPALTLL